MDASPDVLAESVRAKRVAVDNDLELLRVRLQRADPRRVDVARLARTTLPIAAGTAALWAWTRRRRPMRSLEDLLVHGLQDLYAAERIALPALEDMAARATDPELRKALETHCRETEGHLERLTRAFRSVGTRPARGRAPSGMAGIIADGEALLNRKADPHIRDACVLATAERIEHLEIATYGSVSHYAATLGFTYAAELLQQTLEEERAAAEKLSHLGERFVNPRAIRSGAR